MVFLYISKKNKMKKIALIFLVTISLTSCFNRIGKLTICSTRNMDSKTDYVLIAKDVRGKCKTDKKDALETAIDRAVKKYPTGEFMKNAIFYVSGNGEKIEVIGDVWGTPPPIDLDKK